MTYKNLDLTGRTGLVTGGSSGIRLVTTPLLAVRGARVLITMHNGVKLAAAGNGLETLINDAADPEALGRLLGQD